MKSFFTISELILLNKKGLFPGPKEKEEDFFLRVSQSKEREEKFPIDLLGKFDINPDWIDVIYSNESLSLWEGGCTWIWKDEVQIQLKTRLKKSRKIFFIYFKDELLMHEAIHACRMKFEGSEFEEILAYQTSNNTFRQYLGPLFFSPKEVLITVFMFLLGLMCSFFSFSLGLFIMGLFPAFYIFRLRKALIYFNKAKKRIYSMTGFPPLWILLRLSDQEIKMFSSKAEDEINKYITKKREESFRWKQLYFSYFV